MINVLNNISIIDIRIWNSKLRWQVRISVSNYWLNRYVFVTITHYSLSLNRPDYCWSGVSSFGRYPINIEVIFKIPKRYRRSVVHWNMPSYSLSIPIRKSTYNIHTCTHVCTHKHTHTMSDDRNCIMYIISITISNVFPCASIYVCIRVIRSFHISSGDFVFGAVFYCVSLNTINLHIQCISKVYIQFANNH